MELYSRLCEQDLSGNWEEWKSTVISSAENAIGGKKKKIDKPRWWDKDCENASMNRSMALKQYKHRSTNVDANVNYLEYKKRAEATRTMKRKKKERSNFFYFPILRIPKQKVL